MTGQLPTQIAAWDNASPLGCDVPTYAHYLRKEGYETVLAGKMHFIGEQLHGFEERLTTDIYPGDFGWYVEREGRPLGQGSKSVFTATIVDMLGVDVSILVQTLLKPWR